jgi:tetrahydromethanopterin S-methyltransferase subunit E
MDTFNSLAIIAFAALIHASFQLSVSVLTLLSSHAIGRQTAHSKLIRLTGGFLLGVGMMTLLLLSFIAYMLQLNFGSHVPLLMWAIACGLVLGLGFAVWAFYYRREKGTSLWLPRGIARFLSERAKATKDSSESFSLGLVSVIAELVFIFAPMLMAGLVLMHLDPTWKVVGLGLYTSISLLSLSTTYVLIGSGHKISSIQKWREDNKRFLQFAAGSGLVVLGFYMYVDQIMTVTMTGGTY